LCTRPAHPPYELQPRPLVQVIQADRGFFPVAFDGNDIVLVEALFEPAAVAGSNEDAGVADFGIDEEVVVEARDVAVVEPLFPLVDLGGTEGTGDTIFFRYFSGPPARDEFSLSSLNKCNISFSR
jgi:hypothetical protein